MRWMPRAILLLVIACLAPLARAGTDDASAQPPAATGAGLPQLLAPVPAGIRGIVVLHDPVAIRSRLIGSEPAMALARLGFLGPFDRPWQALASAMDRTSPQLVDDLIGGGLVLIATDLPQDPANAELGPRLAWSALSLVSEDTATLMRERVRAIPAMLVQGQPVYAIEDGSLWLIIRPLPAPIGGRSHVLVITSPDGGEARIEPIARMLAPRDNPRAEDASTGPWSLATGLIDSTAADTPSTPTIPAADVSVIWQLKQPEPIWVGAVMRVEADRWRIAGASAAMSMLPSPLSDPGLVDRLIAADPRASLLLHMHGDMTIAGVISPGESFTHLSRTAAGKPMVTHGARAESIAAAATALDQRAAAIRSLLSTETAADAALDAVLPQLEPTTWRQMPLPLRSGSPLRAVFGPHPTMAWRAVATHGGAWSIWLLDPTTAEADAAEPGSTITAQFAAASPAEVTAYIARLRLRPRELRDSLPPIFTLPLMDVGVVRVVDADAWVEPVAGSSSRRVRMRAEVRFGKP